MKTDTPEQRFAAPSPSLPLLRLLAGEFAERLAGFPADLQQAFFCAPLERRHLVLLALAHHEDLNGATVVELLQRRLRTVLSLAVPEPPKGLARALSHLGERPWPAAAYRALPIALSCPASSKSLRHAELLPQRRILGIAGLPGPLRAPLAKLPLGPPQAAIVSQAWDAILARDGAIDPRMVERWGGGKSRMDLIYALELDLGAEPLVGPRLPEPYRPILSKADLHETGLRYDNCLRSSGVVAGCAYYERRGEPGVIVEIERDALYGWVLIQSRLRKNCPTPEATRTLIVDELTKAGVRIGANRHDLVDAVWDTLNTPPPVKPRTAEEILSRVFGDARPRRRRRRGPY